MTAWKFSRTTHTTRHSPTRAREEATDRRQRTRDTTSFDPACDVRPPRSPRLVNKKRVHLVKYTAQPEPDDHPSSLKLPGNLVRRSLAHPHQIPSQASSLLESAAVGLLGSLAKALLKFHSPTQTFHRRGVSRFDFGGRETLMPSGRVCEFRSRNRNRSRWSLALINTRLRASPCRRFDSLVLLFSRHHDLRHLDRRLSPCLRLSSRREHLRRQEDDARQDARGLDALCALTGLRCRRTPRPDCLARGRFR